MGHDPHLHFVFALATIHDQRLVLCDIFERYALGRLRWMTPANTEGGLEVQRSRRL